MKQGIQSAPNPEFCFDILNIVRHHKNKKLSDFDIQMLLMYVI